MIVVGITGNLSSGKTAAAKLFKKLGAQVLDTDAVAKKLTKKGTPIHQAIVKIFGGRFVRKSGELDRRKLARYVFSHPDELKKLNILVHPGVIFEAYKAIEKTRGRKGVLMLDVPLLFEARMEQLCDATVLVKASEPVMLKRAAQRGIPRALAQNILGSQWPSWKKERVADFVLENDGTPKELEAQVRKIWKRINE